MNHKDMLKFMKSRVDSATALAKLRGAPVPTLFVPEVGPYDKLIDTANGALRKVFGPFGVGKESNHDVSDAIPYLRAAGFKLLGNGHFSVAVGHPDLPGKCIKLSIRKEDSGAAFAAYCRANPQDVHLPSIEYIRNMSNCVAIVMPKYARYLHDYEHIDADYAEVYAAIHRKDAEWLRRKKIDTSSSAYASAAAIRKFFDGLAQFDLHAGNVMRDDKGTLIIIDPVSFKQQ